MFRIVGYSTKFGSLFCEKQAAFCFQKEVFYLFHISNQKRVKKATFFKKILIKVAKL